MVLLEAYLATHAHLAQLAIINIRISVPFMRDTTRARARKYGKDMRDCHLVARTCDNEVGVAISIRDPYTSPFTSRCKFARCLLLVRCLCSETVAIGFLISVEPNFVERTALGSLKRRRSYSRRVNDAITSERSVLKKNPILYFMPVSR